MEQHAYLNVYLEEVVVALPDGCLKLGVCEQFSTLLCKIL